MQFQLNHIIFFCADVERMARFYVEVMGLRAIEESPYKREDWLKLEGGTFTLCLHKSGKPGSPSGNKNKIVFKVEDVGAARECLLGHGVKMGVHHRFDEMEFSDGHDPEGNKFQITGLPRGDVQKETI